MTTSPTGWRRLALRVSGLITISYLRVSNLAARYGGQRPTVIQTPLGACAVTYHDDGSAVIELP